MKVLVTGGNGFLGRHIVGALRNVGATVRVFARRLRPDESGVEQIIGDLLTSSSLESAFDGVDVLVHLAASTQGKSDELIHNTAEGTRRLLRAMARTSTRRIVLASSFSVYNWASVGRSLSEEDETLDQVTMREYDPYARAKVLQEILTRDFAREHGFTLTVLRPAVIWGQSVWGEFLIGKTLGPIQTVVAPSAPIRLVYVENAVDAFVLAAQRTTGSELVLNVIDDPQLTTWQYARVVQQRLGGFKVALPYSLVVFGARLASFLMGGSRRLPFYLQPRLVEALHKPVTWSNRRLRVDLGWTPRFTFDQALARTKLRYV